MTVLGFVVGPSAQPEKTYCVPVAPAWGLANETMQEEPLVHCWVEGVVPPVPQPVPDTVNDRFVGKEVIVTSTVVVTGLMVKASAGVEVAGA